MDLSLYFIRSMPTMVVFQPALCTYSINKKKAYSFCWNFTVAGLMPLEMFLVAAVTRRHKQPTEQPLLLSSLLTSIAPYPTPASAAALRCRGHRTLSTAKIITAAAARITSERQVLPKGAAKCWQRFCEQHRPSESSCKLDVSTI
jgi:hypothetical protein